MAKVTKNQPQVESFTFGKRNLLLLSIGLFTIVVGLILMAQEPVDGFLSRTLAPIILVVAYLVIIPISIIAKNKD